MPHLRLLRRQRTVFIVCIVLFGVLSLRLFGLQCIEGTEMTELALAQSDRLVYSASARGSILDRYGRVLAKSVSVPQVRLHPSEIARNKLNNTIRDACALLVSSAEPLACTLPLALDPQDNTAIIYYTQELLDFQSSVGVSQQQTADGALHALRAKLKIPSSFSAEEALFAASILLAESNRTALVNELKKDDVPKLQAIGAELFGHIMLQPGSLTGCYDIVLDPESGDSLDAATALRLYRALSERVSVCCAPGSTNLPLALDSASGAIVFAAPEIVKLRKDLDLSETASAGACLQELKKRYGIEESNPESALRVAAVRLESTRLGTPANHSVVLAADVSETTVTALTRSQDSLPGIHIEHGYVRQYPSGVLLSPVLGHIGRIPAEQAQTYSDLGYSLDNDLVGRDGIEKQYEEFLRGVPSVTSVEVDAWGRPTKERTVSAGQAGQDIILTIDADVQSAAENALAQTMKDIQSGRLGNAYKNANVGAAVAMDVRTGQVICMASLPNYDPNLFATGTISKADWEALSPRYYKDGTLFEDTDPTLPRPLVNNAVSTAFPPGSTFKMAVAIAGLTENAISKDETILDLGRYTKYSKTNAPTCWLFSSTGGTHGRVNIVDALAVSCNYFFYELGDRLGADAIEKIARKLGLGEKTGIDLPGEASGSVDSAKYYVDALEQKVYDLLKSALPKLEEDKLVGASRIIAADTTMTQIIAHLKELQVSDTGLQNELNDLIQAYRYRPANVLSSAIGQGGHTTTLIQMASYTAQIANGGTRVVPTLFAGTTNHTPAAPATQVSGKLGVSQSVLDTVKSGMEKAVSSGTASSAFKGCKLSVAGKTGSAQMSGKAACAWFVGYAPADNPQIAVAVLIAQGGQGTYAAPVGRAILEACFEQGTGTALTYSSGLTP